MPPADVFVLASRRIAVLLDVDGCGIVEFASSESAVVAGAWANGAVRRRWRPGTILPLTRGDDMHRVYSRRRAPCASIATAPGKRAARMGYGCSLTTPVHVRGRLWGVIAVASVAPESLPADAERVLDDFAELIGLAVANTEAHARARRAGGHRSAHAAWPTTAPSTSACARSSRARCATSAPLALALLDVDHFKAINDALGHERGDAVLAAVAATLSDVARTEDVLARLGGDEFALLMPETGGDAGARRRRARARARSPPIALGAGLRVTLSAGVCDLEHAGDPDAPRPAGRRRAVLGQGARARRRVGLRPRGRRELSTAERADQLQRSQALSGSARWRAPIDAKDQSTREHSQRVATLAARDGAPSWTGRRRPRRACSRTPRSSTTWARSASPDACCSSPAG